MLQILVDGGFNNKRSGDTPAGICLAPKFHAAYSYNEGVVIQCEIHGFQHPLHPRIMKAYRNWTGEYIPIGMNSKMNKKGTPLGQVTSHPKNLCIKYIYLQKNMSCQHLLFHRIQTTAGACYATEPDPLAALQTLLAKRAAYSSEADFRVLDLAPNLDDNTTATTGNSGNNSTPEESSCKLENTHNADAPDGVETVKQRPCSAVPRTLKIKRLRPPISDKKPEKKPLPEPVDLKEALGDDRFNWRTRPSKKERGRQHVCDACCRLFLFQSQARPFDGQWTHKFPKDIKDVKTLRKMHLNADHNFTWICTECQFECSTYTDIDEFREHLGIDFTEHRQKRTRKKS